MCSLILGATLPVLYQFFCQSLTSTPHPHQHPTNKPSTYKQIQNKGRTCDVGDGLPVDGAALVAPLALAVRQAQRDQVLRHLAQLQRAGCVEGRVRGKEKEKFNRLNKEFYKELM